MNYLTIHAKAAVQTSDGTDPSGKFVMADSDEVLIRDWPDIVKDPTLYASVDACLDAAETRFAVGQNYNGLNVKAVTRVGNERVEVTLGE